MDMETAESKGDKNPAFLANEEYKEFLKVSHATSWRHVIAASSH